MNTDAGHKRLLAQLQTVHHRLAAEVAAAMASTSPGTEMLLEAIGQGRVSASLLREPSVQRRLEASRIPGVLARLEKLTENLPPQDELLARRIAQRRQAFLAAKPDAKRGREIFEKECAICHQLGVDGKELRIAHDEIDERFTSPLSPMPNAAEKTVEATDFSHLVRYLLDAKQKPKEPAASQ